MAEKLPVEAMSPVARPRSSKNKDRDIMDKLYIGEVEQSFKESSYHPDSQKEPYNPDTLVEKDYTYGVYEQMMDDEQIEVALQVKKDLVIGSGWHIQSSDDDIKKDLEEILTDYIDRPLTEILNDIIQAYEFGFSLSEKIFHKLRDGRLAVKDIKPRHPSTWLIHTDPHGNVTRYEQRAKQTSIDIPPEALIHYVNNQKYQNPYGISDLRTAYQAYITKRHITRYYAIFLENAAGPKPVAKYDPAAPESAVTDIYNAIKNFQAKTAMAIPKGIDLEYLETTGTGEAYIKGINLFNMFIGRALFLPDLMGMSGGETCGGSFSLGKEQIGVFYKHINRRRSILENIIDKHIIRPLVTYNYGFLDEMPKFKLNPISDDDAKAQAEQWVRAVQGVGYKPTLEEVNHFRDLIKFPQSEELEFDAPQPVQIPGQIGKRNDEEEMEDDEETEEKKEFGHKHHKLELPLDTLPGDYKKKVNFKLLDQTTDTAEKKIVNEADALVDEIFDDMFEQLNNKKILQTQDLKRLKTVKLKNLSKLNQLIKRNLRNTFVDGRELAKNEVRKSDFATNALDNDDFYSFIDEESFKYVGDWSYEITKQMEQAMINAIKDGKSLSQVIQELEGKTKKMSKVSLERYARTKTTEVFNRGRREYFDSTGVVAAYQYSAVLDNRTTFVCDSLHGKIFDKNSAPNPPLHFNCRSVLIPITRFEEFQVDNKTNFGDSIDKTIESEVTSKGFSVFGEASLPDKKVYTRKPKIDDPDVSVQTEIISDTQDLVLYSLNGEVFQETTVDYEDAKRTVIKNIQHKRLDEQETTV